MESDRRSACTIVAILVLLPTIFTEFAVGGELKGFQKLNPASCYAVGEESLMKLPATWRSYAAFIRSCPLRKKADQTATVSIIAVWVEEYYASKPADAPWEAFPKPLIVDERGNKIGELPELYPVDEPRELDVYYGKWKLGKPTEILVDVYNPAVSGDYYYSPIVYHHDSRKYMMKNSGVTYGRRRR